KNLKSLVFKIVDKLKSLYIPFNTAKIEKTLREKTMLYFKELGGNGYARCDYRMDANGDIYMLEINPNCGIFYPPNEPGSADFSLMNDKQMNHTKFMKLIIRSAQRRQTRIAAERIIRRQRRKQRELEKQLAFN